MYFNLMPDKEDEREIVEQISSGVSFRGANLWVLIFAIFIASLGLNVNSTAVIIGAMLISPLMGPIVGMGLAVGTNDLSLLKRAGKNFGVATLISVLTATIYFLVTPLSEAQSELLARTSPTLYDVLIAFCGGAAGIIALCPLGCCHRHSPDAPAVYGRFRPGNRSFPLFPRRLLSLLHQHGVHRPRHLLRRAPDAFPHE